ncbi:protein bark beetle [Agrilus planipennis]|uniref:Protein bark beetle n=1 Tax=Agrilus planipennis TaxID=224129 RepID=A0A7F5R4K6_AGRPL|nr:protein bark beetle [Agrilus planipennis]
MRKMLPRGRTSRFVLTCTFLMCLMPSNFVRTQESVTEVFPSPPNTEVHEHPGGIVTDNKLVFSRTNSPYWLRNDLIVERNAEVVIEPGVEMRFEPQVGITVRGILTALGTESERITFTTSADVSAEKTKDLPLIRLVDGPSILEGRVQLFHNGKWRSVCTNSRNWTLSDITTACRQLGFLGGSFSNWCDREMPPIPRLLYEEPNCIGNENSLFECNWSSRQLGSGVCDYHPDIAIRCLPRHETPLPYWRGIRFEFAQHEKVLTLDNTLYLPTSLSRLSYVIISHAGTGRDQNATSALNVEGVPPVMNNLEIFHSAYNGVNVTTSDGPLRINNCILRNNRGYGIFINSSYGMAHIDGCVVTESGSDGIRYVHGEERPNDRQDKSDISDFCTLAITSGQTYPIHMFVDQSIFLSTEKFCSKVFTTRYGHRLTLNFIRAETNRNNSAGIQVFDGSSPNSRLLTSFLIRNNTRPQSVTSTRHQIFIAFKAEPRTSMFMYMTVSSGLTKTYELNVSRCDISDNNGRGISFDNLRSQVHIHKSSISKNNHVAGFHVTSGNGDVNVTESRISFNEGDGINITYTGGNRNISRTSLTSNERYGLAIWLNDTKETEYIYVNQTTVVEYSEIIKNLDIGILHGNFCDTAYINITGNKFQNSLNDALQIMSCWKETTSSTKLQIGHNNFLSNAKIGIKIMPALNFDGIIEYNWFKYGLFGGLVVRNPLLEEFNALKTSFLIEQNYFIENNGVFAVNLGLSTFAQNQFLLFTRNFVRYNNMTEPFLPEDGSQSLLNPRSRVAAPIVVASDNVDIFRNIIDNPSSKYEIGSQLEDQSKIINCTYNWLGSTDEATIFHRLFDRNHRYNLAKIAFIPYLIHNSNPLTSRFNPNQLYVPTFAFRGSNKVGGEVEGEETLSAGEYIVEKDINIRPGGKLTLEPGVTLKFPPSIGMMVGGKLEARGVGPDSITFTLKEEITFTQDNANETQGYDSETEMIEVESKIPIRLLGGKTASEGRLQIKIDNRWGTVCNYGWDIIDAALVCHQLGFALNPDDWFLERVEIPDAGTNEDVILTNVECSIFDTDITKCKAERKTDFENTCTHEHDVGIRCYESSWAGVRFGALSERTDMMYMTIEKAGLLDYATNSFKPALQIDFAHHNFENIRVINNYYDGFGVTYSDIYTMDSVNAVKSSEFSFNKGAGISFKQLGLRVHGCSIQNNQMGIRHNPALTGLQQREIAGWFSSQELDYLYNKPFFIPEENDINVIFLSSGQKKFLVTKRIFGEPVVRSYRIRCDPGYVLGIQLINPIENRSSELIIIHDSQTYNNNSDVWLVNRDLTVFPATSSSYGIILDYLSGSTALGGVVIVVSSITAPVQNIPKRIKKGPVPTLTVTNSIIKNNQYGVHVSYYNRYLDELGNHFLRKANETLKFVGCEISHNVKGAILTHSPFWDLHKSNISEIIIMINNSLIVDNGKGIEQFSRDLRYSNNLFHYVLQDNTFERNNDEGFKVLLPFVWDYNENFTHSIYMNNVTWRRNKNFRIVINGHFAIVNITKSTFSENQCKNTLLSFKGMEKKMLIDYNTFDNNNGKVIVEFSSNSQSEILGEVPARFVYNELKNNRYISVLTRGGQPGFFANPTTVIGFRGIQKVKVNRNLLWDNALDYQLIAGIKTAKINNFLDITENWWGTNEERQIEARIFDFDDWNDHAVAVFKPYLLENSFVGSVSVSFETKKPIDLDNLGGRLTEDLVIEARNTPYRISSDITVMPGTTLSIQPGVVMEFAPNVGILVLGTLKAIGFKGYEIIMRPIPKLHHPEISLVLRKREAPHYLPQIKKQNRRELENLYAGESIRLCKDKSCSDKDQTITNEGFLEYLNKTTLQWIPMCDPRFTERNAQVVCRELGYDSINVFFDYDIRIEYHSNSLTRIWSWPEPLQCTGREDRYEDCPIRLNGQQYGHRHSCKWNSKFIFIHCGKRNLRIDQEYWGGIRFASPEFEQHFYEHRIHDVKTHNTFKTEESVLELINIVGAGILHNEKSPAIQAITRSPRINFVNITRTASHGINLISPTKTIVLLENNIQNTLGVGINILSLTGEGRESAESSFTPLKDLNIPYNLFGLIDICDTIKEIQIEERVVLYYKYDNHPVSCIKIFRSAYNVKPFGFRLLQFNLFNATESYGIPDFIDLYDGDIYNVTSTLIARISMDGSQEKTFFTTKNPSLSIKLFAKGASSNFGFIAEIVTLPISAIGFNRDVQHNISTSSIINNREGGILYMTAGEVNPIVTIEKSQFIENCEKLYGNFTTCKGAVNIDVQNTQTLYFRNNLVQSNQGGLLIKADSRGSATSLKGYIYNNLFVNNSNLPALYVEGRKSSPYQEVTVYRNYFTRNVANYENNIVLKQVVSNFTFNYIKRNIGLQNLEVSGFDRVRLPIYQTTSHNGFYHNYAMHRDSRSTVIAGTAGQHYVDNIFFNPDNDYEMITVNRSLFNFSSTLEIWKTRIDAEYNYWGYNTTLAVSGRIRDQRDDPTLLEVSYEPFYMNNETILDGKCPPGWDLVGDTCYIYIGAPMSFYEARRFCQEDNASMPFLIGNVNYLQLFNFLRHQQQWYLYSDRVWVQHIDMVNQCTMFSYQTVEVTDCTRRQPFICEIDPKVFIDPLTWYGDAITIAVIGTSAIGLLLIVLIAVCWWSKSKYRQAQRLERRNSIRQSLHSVRSLGSIHGAYADSSFKRKGTQMSSRSTDTLTKTSDYKKVTSNGSIDSMEKSTYSSSIDDSQSYDIYETHNPNPSGFAYNPTIDYQKVQPKFATQYSTDSFNGLAFRNEGFRDNSTFASANQSRAESSINEETPIIHSENSAPSLSYPPNDYYNTDTLPLASDHGVSTSTLDLKRGIEETNRNNGYYREIQRMPEETKPPIVQRNGYQQKPKKYALVDLPAPPDPPAILPKPKKSSPTYAQKLENLQFSPDYNTVALENSEAFVSERPKSANILETDFDQPQVGQHVHIPKAKSEASLETNFDYFEPEETISRQTSPHLSRSRSQPVNIFSLKIK